MKKLLDRCLSLPLFLRAQIRERRRGYTTVPAGRAVSVYYGYEQLPTTAQRASGGIVKCQDLAEIFPNTRCHPNILYLVSSALPPMAPLVARRCLAAGGKVVLNQNGVVYPGWYGAGWEEANRPMAEVHRQADHVFYQSDFCRIGAQRFLGRRDGPSEVLYNPVNTDTFSPRRDRTPRRGPGLLIAGSHHFRYRMKTAVDVLAGVTDQLPDARLVVAGHCSWLPSEAESIDDLKRYAESKGVLPRIDILGPYTQEQAPEVFRSADVLLHTKYNDPCPRVVVEAMSCGLPIVYSSTGGVPELVGEEAGVGIPGPLDWEMDHPPSAEGLTAAIPRVMRDYDRFSAAARRRAAARFGVGPWLARHKEVFESLVW